MKGAARLVKRIVSTRFRTETAVEYLVYDLCGMPTLLGLTESQQEYAGRALIGTRTPYADSVEMLGFRAMSYEL